MPKKKAGKKGAKIIDGVATNEMSRDQLMGHVKRMQTELDREREERNFFMLEREKLFSLWNMTLEQIAVEKERARLIQVQLADGEKEREEEMKVHKQKLRFLMMEQSKKLATVRLQHLEKMKRLQNETKNIQETMVETLNGKKMELAKAKSSIYEITRRIRTEYMEEIARIRNDCSAQLRTLESEFNRRLFARQMNSRCDDVLANLNIPLAEQSEDLLAVHENQLTEMKEFYNGITTNNLAIISALQNDLEESKANENCLRMEIKKLKQQQAHLQKLQSAKDGEGRKASINKSLGQGKLHNGNEEVERREKRPDQNGDQRATSLKSKGVDVKIVNELIHCLKRRDQYSRMLESKNEILFQRTLALEQETQDLQSTFARAILEVQRKSSMTQLISELKNSAANVRGKPGFTNLNIGFAPVSRVISSAEARIVDGKQNSQRRSTSRSYRISTAVRSSSLNIVSVPGSTPNTLSYQTMKQSQNNLNAPSQLGDSINSVNNQLMSFTTGHTKTTSLDSSVPYPSIQSLKAPGLDEGSRSRSPSTSDS